MNSSINNNNINIVIKVEKKGFILYDETKTFIDFFEKQDEDLLLKRVNEIIKDRLNGVQSTSLW